MLEEDRPLLQKLAKECKDAKECIRYLAPHAVSEGLVAKIFCVDKSSIYVWITRWESEKNLSDKPKSERPPTLTKEEKQDLKRSIDENDPQAHGISASFWDCKELRRYQSISRNLSNFGCRCTRK